MIEALVKVLVETTKQVSSYESKFIPEFADDLKGTGEIVKEVGEGDTGKYDDSKYVPSFSKDLDSANIDSFKDADKPLNENGINEVLTKNNGEKELNLQNNNLENTKQGGAYKDLPSNGGENHHMPADSVSPFNKGDGPAINMDKADHRQTASCGNSREAQDYREKQNELIEQGKFKEAQQMDIDDIRDKFGDKYDDAIKEMEEYTDKILQNSEEV